MVHVFGCQSINQSLGLTHAVHAHFCVQVELLKMPAIRLKAKEVSGNTVASLVPLQNEEAAISLLHNHLCLTQSETDESNSA